jgi:phospho-N-acetylmuramoyl-pentapeptide-transferase
MKLARRNKDGISGKLRLFLEFGFAGAAMAYLVMSNTWGSEVRLHLQLPFTDFYAQPMVLPAWLYATIGAFVIVGTANAVNLTDGLDGLAIGPSIMNAGVFLVLAYIAGLPTLMHFAGQDVTVARYLHVAHLPGAEELAVFAAALFGAGIGFLWYNAYPAQVFMGDVGALSLGGSIGMLAVLTKNELVLLISGGLFVVEALSVMIQTGVFKATKKPGPDGKMVGKRVFRMAPIHHHYEKIGWDEPKIIVRFWLVSALLALLALGTLKLR